MQPRDELVNHGLLVAHVLPVAFTYIHYRHVGRSENLGGVRGHNLPSSNLIFWQKWKEITFISRWLNLRGFFMLALINLTKNLYVNIILSIFSLRVSCTAS